MNFLHQEKIERILQILQIEIEEGKGTAKSERLKKEQEKGEAEVNPVAVKQQVPEVNVRARRVEKDEQLDLFLEFYNDVGEILYYAEEGLVVTKPRDLVQSLIDRIINHHKIKKIKNDPIKKRLVSRGFFLRDWFVRNEEDAENYKRDEKSKDDVYWKLLETLGIGKSPSDGDDPAEVMFVPLLIGDESKEKFMKEIKDNIEEGYDPREGDWMFPFTVTYRFRNIKGNSMNILPLLGSDVAMNCKLDLCYSKKIEERSSCFLSSALKGTTGGLEKYPNTLIQEDSQGDVHYILAQYQRCDEAEEEHFINVMFYIDYTENMNDDESKAKIVEAVNEFDQMFEKVARSVGGYLERSSGCFRCISDCLGTDSVPKLTCFCKKSKEEEDDILQLVKLSGNFKDFQELSLEEENEKEFLEGALQITRTTFKEAFEFRGRTARYRDFYDAVEYLWKDHKQVKFIFNYLNVDRYIKPLSFFRFYLDQ